MKKFNQLCSFLIMSLFITGCFNSGYKYSIIEDDNFYLLKGRYFNNHPFIYKKAILPNSYLVKKNLVDDIAMTNDIQSTGLRNDEILDGFIVDHFKEVEIHLLIFDHRLSKKREPAYENGTYTLETRKQVNNLREYILQENKNSDYLVYPMPPLIETNNKTTSK